jgi:dTMP kinase
MRPGTARGRFITFEGGEGVGKSTQLRLLAATLREAGIGVVTTREPGGSKGAEEIRSLLVQGHAERWDPLTEALLHSAARRDHLVKTILPALAAGHWVISDRFADSTLAYQGYGHGLPTTTLDILTRLVLDEVSPDLTIVLDLPAIDGLRRAAARGGGEDRYESMDHAFHDRLRQGFLAIARANPARCVVVDAGRPVAEVQASVCAAVAGRLGPVP